MYFVFGPGIFSCGPALMKFWIYSPERPIKMRVARHLMAKNNNRHPNVLHEIVIFHDQMILCLDMIDRQIREAPFLNIYIPWQISPCNEAFTNVLLRESVCPLNSPNE